ncbi:STAS/SEC14 domain-containing protein [Marinomonas rhizomae]|uniref:STAS/SEC14 domain-containing protein n=1 Tax=Marinomonas rhizomae TaxID=491948 RepID=UPI002107A641|nr:STAS/SEC14 domain-containing protein [Marinomonas rhizomae]UTV99770.1 STAS/SEC14 domain-containing protein [Marinomonas rhizomae]
MTTYTNGVSLNAKRYNDKLLLNVKTSGHPSDMDFESITPKLEAALYTIHSPYAGLLVDISEFEGWSMKSAWSEFLLSQRLGGEFNRIAIYGKSRWQNRFIRVISWFISADIKVFKRKKEATDWVMSS